MTLNKVFCAANVYYALELKTSLSSNSTFNSPRASIGALDF